tara:strand:+ start:45 stop:215 length:171 start_codon:yes stop_codon:yes gene_type:complete
MYEYPDRVLLDSEYQEIKEVLRETAEVMRDIVVPSYSSYSDTGVLDRLEDLLRRLK